MDTYKNAAYHGNLQGGRNDPKYDRLQNERNTSVQIVKVISGGVLKNTDFVPRSIALVNPPVCLDK